MTSKRSSTLLFRYRSSILVNLLIAALVVLNLLEWDEAISRISKYFVDPGDCKCLGRKRPFWASRYSMVKALPAFSKIYEERPFKQIFGGMRFEHSFALWFMLLKISPVPSFVIESGSGKGQSTWIIRKALPHAKIITIDPVSPIINISNTISQTGDEFKDFKDVQWSAIGVEPKNSIVLFGDHQNGFRRVFREARKEGFQKFILNDNCYYPFCDITSIKWICNVEEKEWGGYHVDNFGKEATSLTWEEHMGKVEEVKSSVKLYYEFPPLKNSDKRSSNALFHKEKSLKAAVGEILDEPEEFAFYNNICYLELKDIQ